MRLLDNWIKAYLQMVSETEPAQRFHLWTVITILGALLGRKCFIRLGPELVFPNLYVVLVGPPGVRKGRAISYGVELLDELESGVVARGPDVITKEQLVVRMERAQQVCNIGGEMLVHCSLFVVAPELVNFIGENDYERLGYLCQLYDGLPRFEYETKTSGHYVAVNPALWILGATTPNWIEIAMKQLGVGGGITSRIIFVYSDRKGRHIPLSRMKPFNKELREKLIADLASIRTLVGEFSMTEEARRVFEEWYGYDDVKGVYQESCIEDKRFDSYWNRLPTMVVKVAMVLSAAKREDKIIHASDITQAIRMFNHIHPEMPRAFGGLGHNVIGAQTEMVRSLLREHGRAAKSYIMRTLRMHISEWDYQRIKMSLLAEKFCTREFDAGIGEEVLVCQEKTETVRLDLE